MDRSELQRRLETTERLLSQTSIEAAKLRLTAERLARNGHRTESVQILLQHYERALAAHERDRKKLIEQLDATSHRRSLD